MVARGSSAELQDHARRSGHAAESMIFLLVSIHKVAQGAAVDRVMCTT
jgi:hypothetical protein